MPEKREELIQEFAFVEEETVPHKHHHLYSELIFVQEGTALFLIGGKCYLAEAGSVLFVSSLEPHETTVQSAPYRRFFLTVNSSLLQRMLDTPLLSSVFQNRSDGFTHKVNLEEYFETVCWMFFQMQSEFQAKSPFWEKAFCNVLENLLILTYRACPGNFAQQDNTVSSRITAIQRHIERHFAEEIRVADLAREHYVSPSYLSHVFRAQTGYSPKQYVLLNRLSYAKELLETTGLQISRIAYDCGFGDVNNFIRAFREWYGLSPGVYRSRCISLAND